jgi:hypothetical protein
MIFITRVNKLGDINSYINKPVIDRTIENNEENVIGEVVEAIELDNYYELTIKI